MNSIIKDKWLPSKTYWNAIPIIILFGIFCYYFAENFVLSENWEILTLRDIDDYAMQISVHKMQKAMLAKDWGVVFSFFDYAYGNAFWLLNSILLLPFYFVKDEQALIIAGREISLLFVFGTLHIMGKIIDRIRPNAQSIKYPILIALAVMPMTAIISTKLHVNAQSVFFGVLSFYFLIRDEELDWTSLILSAFFAGMAIGFKLTGIFLAPLLGLTLLDKLRNMSNITFFKGAVAYFIVSLTISAACTAPTLLLFPYFEDELRLTFNIFKLFKNMASEDIPLTINNIYDSLQYYLSPLGTLLSLLLFLIMTFNDIKKNKYVTLYILCAIVSTLILIFLTVHKQPLYIATYFINLAFFIPLGFLGILTLKHTSPNSSTMLTYGMISASLLSSIDYRNTLMQPYDFFAKAKNETVKQKIVAMKEMKRLVSPLSLPVRILQDHNTVFPASGFTDGIDIVFNYGNLDEKRTLSDFNYILLSASDYYGKLANTPECLKTQTPEKIAAHQLEESTRTELHRTGNYYGRQYNLIYSENNVLLYKLKTKLDFPEKQGKYRLMN